MALAICIDTYFDIGELNKNIKEIYFDIVKMEEQTNTIDD